MNGAVCKKWRGCIGYEIFVILIILSGISEVKFNNGIINIVHRTMNMKYVRVMISMNFQIHPMYCRYSIDCSFNVSKLKYAVHGIRRHFPLKIQSDSDHC